MYISFFYYNLLFVNICVILHVTTARLDCLLPSASSRWKIVDVKTIIINWMMNWIVFSVSSLQDDLRHKTVSYSEVQYLPVCFLCCYIPLQHSRSHFSELNSQRFAQKQVNKRKYRIIVSSILHHFRASCHAPLILGREPRWRPFDVLRRAMENRGFNQIKNILWQNKLHYFSEKNIGVRCTLRKGTWL